MDRIVDKTIDVLTRFGDTLGRHLSTEDHYDPYVGKTRPSYMMPSAGSAFQRPLDRQYQRNRRYSSKQRDLVYVDGRKYSSDNLAASPGYNSSFSNYRQNPIPGRYDDDDFDTPPYGAGVAAPFNYGYGSNYGGYSGGYSASSSSSLPYSSLPSNVAYAPDYYIAERRQVELVPAPPPRIIQQQVPVPFPVDRPVPQPYPVEVPRYVPVDRPVPIPFPSPVPVDRPVAVPVPIPVRSPPPPPVCVPVPVAVPTPVACYVPVGIPVLSSPPAPVVYEQSVTHSQRWITGSPVIMNQQSYSVGAPAIGMSPYMSYSNGSFIR